MGEKERVIPFCCDGLKQVVELKGNKEYSDIFYLPQYRAFGVSFKGDIQNFTILEYCPFCGTKFPSNLVEKFEEFLLDDYGPDYLTTAGQNISEPIPAKKPLPKEFQTDEWWKKRGL